MSSSQRKSPRAGDLTTVEDDTLGTSISLCVGENSIRIKEKSKSKSKSGKVVEFATYEENARERWWLKKSDVQLDLPKSILMESKMKQTPSPSPDVSSSMKEFLEKEKMCKAMHKSELEAKDKDDTLCDILASAAFDKYPSDFENATDEDIGSILEEMSKIAGALSPNSAQEHTKSKSSIKNSTEEERSVEELLEEAEKLVRKNSCSLSKSGSKSDTLVPDSIIDDKENLSRVRQLEADIFQLIEEEVHKESEKIKKSPKNEKKRESSPGFEVIYENLNGLKPPKSLELQRRKFEEQKVEVSSSSDLDDPIERHSRSEELKSTRKMETDKDNLQKEITDVDKDFFEDFIRKSREKVEGGMSGSSSFGQEDFSHFLKLLQGQTEKKQEEAKDLNTAYNFTLKSTEGTAKLSIGESDDKTPEYPEKEICELLQKELPEVNESKKIEHEIVETDSSASEKHCSLSESVNHVDNVVPKNVGRSESSKALPKSGKDHVSTRRTDTTNDAPKVVVNSKDELYTVGLTPRLELFADAIPKLLAEKSEKTVNVTHENKENIKDTRTNAFKPSTSSDTKISTNIPSSQSDKVSRVNVQKLTTDPHRTRQSISATGSRQQKREMKFCKSKSYDQISKPPFRTSLENVRMSKPLDPQQKPPGTQAGRSPILKAKLQTKTVPKIPPKGRISPKPKKDPIKSGSTLSLSSISKGYFAKSPDVTSRNFMAGGDTKVLASRQNWEVCHEERQKNALLKRQLDSEVKRYKSQIDKMRVAYEEELFALKKENITLKAKVDELSLNERHPENSIDARASIKDTRIDLLEKELAKQENLIRAYETENKKLIKDTKRMQEETKNVQKQKSTVLESNRMHELLDRVKDLEEENLKLNLEVSDLRQKNADYLLKYDDLHQQNGLLNDELQMFKEQLRTKNDFITDRLQAMTTAELELKKQMEDLSIKLSSKTEQLRVAKLEFDKLQQNVLPLEKELLELRVKEGNLQEKIQVAKSHVDREKQLTQRLKDQVILDSKKIMDLNRQVREMERILKRKNPDSVSALILTANSEQDKIGTEKVKLLEERIANLESEIKSKEDVAQRKIFDFQTKFSDMKEKYTTQINELEAKLFEASVKERKILNDMFTQTASKHVESKGVETMKKEDKPAALDKDEKKVAKVNLKSQNPKEDAHLIATIRGLKLELVNKDKTVSKLTKEFQELQKTNRRLQKEREKLLNDRRTIKSMSKSSEGNDQNSNVYQNGHVSDSGSQRLSASTTKLYDPMQYTENSDNSLVKRITNENEILKDELNKINKDFMALKNKRLHDLNLLQEEHEREMATLLKEYSVKFGESKVVKLQGQINTQVAVISHLKQQIEKLRDYKEQVVVLKAEREHLENKLKTMHEKVKYLSTPGTEQLQLLQDKITILQQRHESREMTLQTLVRDLLRNRMQCKDCKNEKGKSRQLCYFRQELDHILGMLQEIANVH